MNQDTIVEVPEPMYIYNNSSVKQKYQINLKSSSAPIDAYLIQSQDIKVWIYKLFKTTLLDNMFFIFYSLRKQSLIIQQIVSLLK